MLVAALGYRAWRQHDTARALAITSPRGIDEARFVTIGGIDQFIQIRGEDRGNPVILVLGKAVRASLRMVGPELRSSGPGRRYFTVVQWDQRGTGKT